MSQLLQEELIPFAKAIRMLPGRPHISTGYRYLNRGIRGKKLEAVLVGGRRYTSKEALRRFIVAVTEAASGKVIAAVDERHSDVEEQLDLEGL